MINSNNPVSEEEYKKITESMYKQSLEQARLYKQVDSLNKELNDLLKQREGLMHLINHKVKGAFTRSKYIFACILDGTFGETTLEIKKYAKEGLKSDDIGIRTIDLVLNANNLQKGTIKYEMKPVDLKEMISKIVAEKKIQIESKDLKIELDIKDGIFEVSADTFWLKEAINNLIENSIKYTKKGTITVGLEKTTNKILITVKDTGIGINEEDKKILFTEGGRGKDSVHINVDSTGYGLYSVKLIVEAHKGRVWGESEGEGKGSKFFVELPTTS